MRGYAFFKALAQLVNAAGAVSLVLARPLGRVGRHQPSAARRLDLANAADAFAKLGPPLGQRWRP